MILEGRSINSALQALALEAEGMPECHSGISYGFLYLHDVKHAAAGFRILPSIHVVIKTCKPFVGEKAISRQSAKLNVEAAVCKMIHRASHLRAK